MIAFKENLYGIHEYPITPDEFPNTAAAFEKARENANFNRDCYPIGRDIQWIFYYNRNKKLVPGFIKDQPLLFKGILFPLLLNTPRILYILGAEDHQMKYTE
jgi:hypothetical protein